MVSPNPLHADAEQTPAGEYPLQRLPHPVLPLARYRLRFRALGPVRLPHYPGSAWRGAFGHALKRLVCVTREPRCADCLLYRSCSYPYLFETPPDPAVGKLRKYTAAPHPYLLLPPVEAPTRLSPGEDTLLLMTLFGYGNRYLAYAIQALAQAADKGLGQNQDRLELIEVRQEIGTDWRLIYPLEGRLIPEPARYPAPPPCPERLTLRLFTPLRLAVNDDHLTPETFRFHHLFSSLLRRISLLTTFHTNTPLETDFAALNRAVVAISWQTARLRWQDWRRYSNRQGKTVPMGGLVGEISLPGEALDPFWPYLWLGQWTHAGKGTVMGLGGYRLEGLA